jgi:DNA-binding response OmpR family regulator
MSGLRVEPEYFVVVDAAPEDYTRLVPVIEEQGLKPRFFASGDMALRHAAETSALCWMINLQLPDMDGTELCGLLRSRLAETTVFLVANRYRRESELAVLKMASCQFACKPLDPVWLRACVTGLTADARRRAHRGSRQRRAPTVAPYEHV